MSPSDREDSETDFDDLRDNVQRRRHRVRVPQKIGDVVSGLMARRGYAQELATTQWREAWRQAAGARLARHSCPGCLKNGVLEVVVRNSTVLQELNFQKKKVLSKLRRGTELSGLRDLRFKVGAVPDSPSNE